MRCAFGTRFRQAKRWRASRACSAGFSSLPSFVARRCHSLLRAAAGGRPGGQRAEPLRAGRGLRLLLAGGLVSTGTDGVCPDRLVRGRPGGCALGSGFPPLGGGASARPRPAPRRPVAVRTPARAVRRDGLGRRLGHSGSGSDMVRWPAAGRSSAEAPAASGTPKGPSRSGVSSSTAWNHCDRTRLVDRRASVARPARDRGHARERDGLRLAGVGTGPAGRRPGPAARRGRSGCPLPLKRHLPLPYEAGRALSPG